VDVRDLAEVHAKALVTEDAKGERFIISAREYEWQQFRTFTLSGHQLKGPCLLAYFLDS
jgi:hypothetical protein